MDGILRCTRYAFGPNRLHYCGPDKNEEIASYMEEGVTDPGLEKLLSQFEAMYPYLQHIARANAIADPFDSRVVEAYWLGNALLEKVGKPAFHDHLVDTLKVKDKLGMHEFSYVEESLRDGAVPHHSYHVLDIWRRGKQFQNTHEFESIDKCRVGWGKVVSVAGPNVTIETEHLIMKDGKIELGPIVEETLTRPLEADTDIEQLEVGDLVSVHWDVMCEVITPEQFTQLKRYTLKHVALANKAI